MKKLGISGKREEYRMATTSSLHQWITGKGLVQPITVWPAVSPFAKSWSKAFGKSTLCV
jgi:hypothetical protein